MNYTLEQARILTGLTQVEMAKKMGNVRKNLYSI